MKSSCSVAGPELASRPVTAALGVPLDSASQHISLELNEREAGGSNAQLEVCHHN